MSVTNGSLMTLLEGGARAKTGPSHCTRKAREIITAVRCTNREPGKSGDYDIFIEHSDEPGVFYSEDVRNLQAGDRISGAKSSFLARAAGWVVGKNGIVHAQGSKEEKKGYRYRGKYANAEEGKAAAQAAFAANRARRSEEAKFRREHGFKPKPVYTITRGARRAEGPSSDPQFYDVSPPVEEEGPFDDFIEEAFEQHPNFRNITRREPPNREESPPPVRIRTRGSGLVGGCGCCGAQSGSALVGGYDGRSGPRTPAQMQASELLRERNAMFREAKVMDPGLTKREFFARFR